MLIVTAVIFENTHGSSSEEPCSVFGRQPRHAGTMLVDLLMVFKGNRSAVVDDEMKCQI